MTRRDTETGNAKSATLYTKKKALAISRKLWYVLWLPKTKELNHT